MPAPDRKQMEALYTIFNEATLGDQRAYYRQSLSRYRTSAAQVNTIRAIFSLLTGLASALAGLLVQSQLNAGQCALIPIPDAAVGMCQFVIGFSGFLMVISIVAPALGAAFGTLADLYQWDRLITIYDVSLENLEVADAASPDPEMGDENFWLALKAYTDGTLNVMRDETAQWGQLIRTPKAVEDFIAEQEAKANQSVAHSGSNPGDAPDSNAAG
jgi:hypothetical protein